MTEQTSLIVNNNQNPKWIKRLTLAIIRKTKFFFRKSRQDKLTLMVIPHSGQNGFHFQINYLHIYYFTLLILSYVFLSFAIQSESNVMKTKRDALNMIHTQDLALINTYSEKFSSAAAQLLQVGKVSSEFYSVIEQTSMRQEKNMKFLFGFNPANTFEKIFRKNEMDLASLKYQVNGSLQIVQSIKEFLSHYHHFDPDNPNFLPVYQGYMVRGYDVSIPHIGLDIAAPHGTPVYAVASGRVVRRGWLGGYGQTVEIAHKNGVHSLYAHNSQLKVSYGDYVDKGDVIALVGTTGRSTGNHLHFEIRRYGKAIDPMPFIAFFTDTYQYNPNFHFVGR